MAQEPVHGCLRCVHLWRAIVTKTPILHVVGVPVGCRAKDDLDSRQSHREKKVSDVTIRFSVRALAMMVMVMVVVVVYGMTAVLKPREPRSRALWARHISASGAEDIAWQ